MHIPDPMDLPTLEQVTISSALTVKKNTLVKNVILWMSQGRGTDLSLSEQDFSSELNLPSQAPSSCALVVENRQLLGIFTERDVVRLIASGMDLSRTEISQVMTQPVVTLALSETQNALTALSLMRQHRIRHLPVVDESGQLVGLVTESKLLQAIAPLEMAEDLSARQQLELELPHRERQFSTLVENSPDIIFRLDRHLRHIYINARVRQESGIPPEQFLGKTGRELGLPTEVCDIFESACYQAFATGEITRVEYRIGDKYFLSRLIPERTTDGAIESLMGIT
ncbi:CBS domain-containing protein [Microseira wollei]|uniref:Multi-sensor Hybrid Histidine Kinase n=1 Tax=Microseira wollei NIES-4236 TaxID=2530354 RepID=A0AAV3XAR5_9CYAN|nr:CBS domain-containing protein [Microseira wollei]GET37499.1 multi-sensor Hybrid Histidine Kinase [Microseira wollei NIES-4236]